jgi:hypothetical protein
LNGIALAEISIAGPPGASPPIPTEMQVVWFRIKPGVALSRFRTGATLNLRISYVQRHVEGKFHYLPQSIPLAADDKSGQQWRFPLIARAPGGLLRITVGESRWERLGDVVVVYLKTDQIISLEAK